MDSRAKEAKRRDDEFAYVAAWERNEKGNLNLKKEQLKFENVKLATRSYK